MLARPCPHGDQIGPERRPGVADHAATYLERAVLLGIHDRTLWNIMRTMGRRGLGILALACSAIVAAGCTSPADRRPEPPQATTHAAAPANAVSPTATMNCDNPITASRHPPAGAQTALGVIAIRGFDHPMPGIPTSSPPYRYFMKMGLLVRTGSHITLDVDDQPQTRVAIAWGVNSPHWTRQLVIPACPHRADSAAWHAYPGGFATDADACIHLAVTAAGRTESIDIPAAAPCPEHEHG